MKTPMLLASILAAAATAASAQQTRSDPRWEAWFGCWTPVDGAAQSPTGKAPTVCVIPAGGGVDVVTVVETSVVARDHIEAAGGQQAVSRAGCTGWETDIWSSQGDRLYRRSEYTCPGDVKRGTSEVLAITPEWEWLDVQGLVARGGTGVRTLRYRSAAVPAVPEIATALAAHMSEISMARAAAAAPLATSDVIEASRAADPAVVEAWLSEEGQGYPLNGKQLLALADSGVPPAVIDVMVAMTYPKVFTVAAAPAGGFNAAEASPRPQVPDTMYADRSPYCGYGLNAPAYGWGPAGYSPWGWLPYGSCSPFYYYSPYGMFSPYGNSGYGGYYYGGPTVIVVTDNGGASNPPPEHGRYVKGHGYQHGDGQTSGSQPTPHGASGSSSSSSAGSAPPPPPPSPAPPSSSSGSSSQVGEHAHPKP